MSTYICCLILKNCYNTGGLFFILCSSQVHLDALAERIPEVSQIFVEEVPLPEPPPEEVPLPEPPHEEVPLPEPPPEEVHFPEPLPEELRLPEPPPEELRLPEPPPEELPTVQPQESEMQVVPHEEELASTEKLVFFIVLGYYM